MAPRIRAGQVWRWVELGYRNDRMHWGWQSDTGGRGEWCSDDPEASEQVWAWDCRSAEVDGMRRQG